MKMKNGAGGGGSGDHVQDQKRKERTPDTIFVHSCNAKQWFGIMFVSAQLTKLSLLAFCIFGI